MIDLKACWQTQLPESTTMTPADIDARIRGFQRRRACEAAFVLPAASVIAALFGWLLWTASTALARASFLIDLAWVGAMVFAVYGRGRRIGVTLDPGLSSIDFHRRQLLAERSLRGALWLWCFLPLVVAYALLVAAAPNPCSPRMLLADAVVTIGFFTSSLVGWAGSRRLQRQIDALNAL